MHYLKYDFLGVAEDVDIFLGQVCGRESKFCYWLRTQGIYDTVDAVTEMRGDFVG